MWLKQWHKPSMTGNALYDIYRYGNLGNGVVLLSIIFSLFNYLVFWIGEFLDDWWTEHATFTLQLN